MFVQLVANVTTYLATAGLTAQVLDGIDARDHQVDFGRFPSGRVAFVPAPSMQILEPTHIGEYETSAGLEQRQLFNVLFGFEVSFAGYDINNAERDLAHRHACFDLWEKTAQAMQASYSGAHQWTGARWEDARKYGRHGAELVATLAINLPIFDAGYLSATPDPVPGQPKPVPSP